LTILQTCVLWFYVINIYTFWKVGYILYERESELFHSKNKEMGIENFVWFDGQLTLINITFVYNIICECIYALQV
jgi:hypothetical protein